MEGDEQKPVKEPPTTLELIRNMWEFANLAQWIFIFGRAVNIDEHMDIEVRISRWLPTHDFPQCTER